MATIILFGFVLGLITFLLQTWQKQKRPGYEYDWSFIVIAVIFGLCLGVFFALPIGSLQETKYVPVETRYLENMSNKYNVSGSFFLGTGRIDGEDYYSYRYFQADGSSVADKVYMYDPYNSVDSQNPVERAHLTIYKAQFADPENWVVKYFTILGPSGRPKYKFVVPRGSVKSEFAIE